MDGDLRAFLAEMPRRKVNNEAKAIFHKLRHPPCLLLVIAFAIGGWPGL
jgi:hypothetical protein